MTTAPDAAAVEAFLQANPDFLAERPQLYAILTPPRRLHGEAVADHMAAMIQAGRQEWRGLLEAGRTRGAFAARVAEAVLALIANPDAQDCLRHEWPAHLGLESCRLVSLVPGPALVVRDVSVASAALHGEAAPLIRREALLRVGNHTPAQNTPAQNTLPRHTLAQHTLAQHTLAQHTLAQHTLALGARDAADLPHEPESLAFLARALSAALAR